MVNELNTDTLHEEIQSNEKVIVQYSAGWCGNCRIMKPKFKKMSSENENMHFLMVDAEKNPNSRKLANVSNLPTFAFFKNGKLVNEVQTNKADVLLNFVDEAANH
ncbi:MAG: thioredoxin family protein [Flavobacteriales bacterium]|jgi:thiol-disulfide isomerase/thioredoxin